MVSCATNTTFQVNKKGIKISISKDNNDLKIKRNLNKENKDNVVK